MGCPPETQLAPILELAEQMAEALKGRCYCEELGMRGSSGPCTACKTLSKWNGAEAK